MNFRIIQVLSRESEMRDSEKARDSGVLPAMKESEGGAERNVQK
jgi:hypothetical protein